MFLDEMGLFKWAAMKAVKLAHNRQISIFISIYLVAAILTTFTSNDIVILTLTPLSGNLAKSPGLHPQPEFREVSIHWSSVLQADYVAGPKS